MGVIVASVVLRGVAVDSELKGEASHVLSIVRPGVFEAIGVISFAVSVRVCCRAHEDLLTKTDS